MGTCWGDVEEGVRIEVVNSDTNLSTKVYWIAEIIKLAGKTTSTGGARRCPPHQICQKICRDHWCSHQYQLIKVSWNLLLFISASILTDDNMDLWIVISTFTSMSLTLSVYICRIYHQVKGFISLVEGWL